MGEQQEQITPQEILGTVSQYFYPLLPKHQFVNEMRSSQKHRRISYPRRIAMTCMRLLCVDQDCPLSYPKIGANIGGKDHSTIIMGCRNIMARYRAEDENVVRDLKAIAALLGCSLLPVNQWPISDPPNRSV